LNILKPKFDIFLEQVSALIFLAIHFVLLFY